jgi:hypothetical protein
LNGAAVREQFEHQCDQISGLPQAVRESPSGGAEGHLALAANVTTIFLGMGAKVASPDLSSGRTIEVGQNVVSGCSGGFTSLIRHKESRRLTSDFLRSIRPQLNGVLLAVSGILTSPVNPV